MSDDRPVPTFPTDLDEMTPRQAWNAALGATEEMIGWEAFWNDGRGVDPESYEVEEDQATPLRLKSRGDDR